MSRCGEHYTPWGRQEFVKQALHVWHLAHEDAVAGFYSYTLGNWHTVALNSNLAVTAGSDQYFWLMNDLAANKGSPTERCTLAYWHHPLFTSGPNGNNASMRDMWNLMYHYGVDVVINGHDHLYERFDPQDPTGRRDLPAGIREFIVGTGGAPLYDFVTSAPNSVARLKAYGVLQLTLRDVGYDSVFIQAGSGMPFDMTFSNLCH
jgi:hypothetical protein